MPSRLLPATRRLAVLAVFALVAAPTARAACPPPSTAADLRSALAEEDVALRAMDGDAFGRQLQTARALVGCLGVRISPDVAAAVHLRESMAALIAGDEAAALQSGRAAVLADAAATLDSALMPEGHPLRDVLMNARALAPPERAPVALAAGATLWVDGKVAAGLPMALPAIAQIEQDGVVRWSALLPPGGALPLAWTAPAKVDLPPPDDTPSGDEATVDQPSKRRGRALALGAGGAALGSAGLYALALSSEARFKSPGEVEDTLDALGAARTRANTLTVGAGALGAAALGLGVAATLAF